MSSATSTFLLLPSPLLLLLWSDAVLDVIVKAILNWENDGCSNHSAHPPFNCKNVSNPYHIENVQYYSTTVIAEVHSFNQSFD
jgi:hypothetical protein